MVSMERRLMNLGLNMLKASMTYTSDHGNQTREEVMFPRLVQVNYSKNHDFLRTVGFIAVLLAVSWMYWVVEVYHNLYIPR